MQKTRKIDINILPEEIQQELFDYYEFLMAKHVKYTEEEKKIRGINISKKKQIFFESVKRNSFNLPINYKFNREELHER